MKSMNDDLKNGEFNAKTKNKLLKLRKIHKRDETNFWAAAPQ